MVMLRGSVGRNRYAGGLFPLLDGARMGRLAAFKALLESINRVFTARGIGWSGWLEAVGDGDRVPRYAALFDRIHPDAAHQDFNQPALLLP